MNLKAPFSNPLSSLIQIQSQSPHCFIDDVEVSLEECSDQVQQNSVTPHSAFWQKECDEYPASSHCKIFD